MAALAAAVAPVAAPPVALRECSKTNNPGSKNSKGKPKCLRCTGELLAIPPTLDNLFGELAVYNGKTLWFRRFVGGSNKYGVVAQGTTKQNYINKWKMRGCHFKDGLTEAYYNTILEAFRLNPNANDALASNPVNWGNFNTFINNNFNIQYKNNKLIIQTNPFAQLDAEWGAYHTACDKSAEAENAGGIDKITCASTDSPKILQNKSEALNNCIVPRRDWMAKYMNSKCYTCDAVGKNHEGFISFLERKKNNCDVKIAAKAVGGPAAKAVGGPGGYVNPRARLMMGWGRKKRKNKKTKKKRKQKNRRTHKKRQRKTKRHNNKRKMKKTKKKRR